MIKSTRITNHGQIATEIYQISANAKEKKIENPNIIDGTVGTLYNEDGSFLENQTLTKVISELSKEEKYPYALIDGGKKFQTLLENWIFGTYVNQIRNNFNLYSMPTLGGTTALSMVFYSYLDINETILLPDCYWSNYSKTLEIMKIKSEEYPMFTDSSPLGKYNLHGFKQQAIKIINQQQKLVALINTPNHNPTGYALSVSELEDIIIFCNEQKNIPIILILDIAYIDFVEYQKSRLIFNVLKKANSNILIAVIFSGSKTFSAYGLRFGAVTYLTKDNDTIKDVQATSKILARALYSNPNQMAINAFIKMMSDQNYKETFICQLSEARLILEKRSILVKECFDQYGIPYYPYEGGFFITIKTTNAFNLYQRLIERNCYTIPLNKGLRIAISSLSLVDIENLSKVLQEEKHLI